MSDDELLAWKPRPLKRQRKLRGPEKARRQRYWRKNRSRLLQKARKYRQKLKNNSAWKRHQKLRRKQRHLRKRLAMSDYFNSFEFQLRIANLYMQKLADLPGTPLGFPGGPCGLVERVKEELPPNQQAPVIQTIQRHGPFPERKVYQPHKTRGAWKFQFELTPHAQYRMDLRSVTEPEIRRAISDFFQEMNALRSRGDNTLWKKFTSFERIEYESKRLHNLVVVFQLDHNGKEVDVITTFRRGEPDPRGSCPSV